MVSFCCLIIVVVVGGRLFANIFTYKLDFMKVDAECRGFVVDYTVVS